MTNFLLKHKAWLLSTAAGVVAFATPSVTTFVTAHPQYAVSVGTLWAVAAAWAKSPRQ
jgi:hypothetical protein